MSRDSLTPEPSTLALHDLRAHVSNLLYRLVEGDDLQDRLLSRHLNTAAQNEQQMLTLAAQLMDVSALQHTSGA